MARVGRNLEGLTEAEAKAVIRADKQTVSQSARARRMALRKCQEKPALEWQRENGAVLEFTPGDDAGRMVAWVVNGTPLDRLHSKGTISSRQYSAGNEFRIKCQRFMGGSKGVASYGERMARGEGDDHSGVIEMDARRSVTEACRTVGERNAAYLMDVCFFECTPSAVAKTLGCHHSTGMRHFQEALDALADFWRI